MFVRDEVARSLIESHIQVCEKGRVEDRHDREVAEARVAQTLSGLERKLEAQDKASRLMHEQNQGISARAEQDAHRRFQKLMWALIPMLLSALGGVTFEVVKTLHQ